MAIFDEHANFAYTNVATAPSPGTSGTSLVVTAGFGALFPTPPFNCVIWPSSGQPSALNAEIVRVTGLVSDTFTLDRAEEGTVARDVQVGDRIMLAITAKVITDIEAYAAAGRPINVVTVTTPGTGTYSPSVDVLAAMIEVVGGGGGGGGAVGLNANLGAGAGGGGGAYVRRLLLGPFGTMAFDYTVGAGGVGGAGAANGSPGDATTFDDAHDTMVADGGAGGASGSTGSTPFAALAGVGGSPSGFGDVPVEGGAGGPGLRFSGTIGVAGFGGPSGIGGNVSVGLTDGFAPGSNPGNSPGGGGSGGIAKTTAGGDATGGTGGDGMLVITEYGIV